MRMGNKLLIEGNVKPGSALDIRMRGRSLVTKCTYPNCDCPVSFPRGHHPSEATQCPRSDSIHVQLTPGEYSFDSGKTWVRSFFEALKLAN